MVANESQNVNPHVDAFLLPQHLKDLRTSGLSDETIQACGFYSEQNAGSVHKLLNWTDGGKIISNMRPFLVMPFWDSQGKRLEHYARVKPDVPRLGKKGKNTEKQKPQKYESPIGKPNEVYFPPLPSLHDALTSPTTPLIITEGEKKAAKACQEGFACIGLVGIYGWHKQRENKKDRRELIPSLAAISWAGRPVYVCFDSDAETNEKVRIAENLLAKILVQCGATVNIIRIPHGAPDDTGVLPKVGIDDFLVQHGSDKFRALMVAAAPPEKLIATGVPNEAPDDPHRLAKLYLDQKCQHRDGYTLRYWQQEWYKWDGAAYHKENDMRAILTPFIKKELDAQNLIAQEKALDRMREGNDNTELPFVTKIGTKLISDVVNALTGFVLVPSNNDRMPCWLVRNSKDTNPLNFLPCKNGLAHLPSIIAAAPEAFLHNTPTFFTTNSLKFAYNADAPKPEAWLTFLNQLWPTDNSSIQTLQEWMGYLLTPDTRQQQICMLIGQLRSGKGTITKIIEQLVGKENVACPLLSSLGNNFGLEPLINKTVAIIQDARLTNRTDPGMVAERLLSISGEDALTIERKFLSSVTTKLSARFMIVSNVLPGFVDVSSALAKRMIILNLPESFYGKEDTTLSDRLSREIPPILNWAVAGWESLHCRGHFVQPKTSLDLVTELEDLLSPVGAFVQECCIQEPSQRTAIKNIYSRWKDWCDKNGRKECGTIQSFSRDLRACVPALRMVRSRSGEERARAYDGIGLKPDPDYAVVPKQSTGLELGLKAYYATNKN